VVDGELEHYHVSRGQTADGIRDSWKTDGRPSSLFGVCVSLTPILVVKEFPLI
jgi:hypothetical protein